MDKKGSPSEQALLVADSAFMNLDSAKRHDFVSVFPEREGDGAQRLTLDELLERSRKLSAYYDAVLPEISSLFRTHMTAAGGMENYFIRPVLVTITSLFVDRCARVLHRMSQYQPHGMAAVAVERLRDVQWLGEVLHTPSTSWKINQEIIERIAISLGWGAVQVLDKSDYPEYPSEYRQRNLLFLPQNRGLSGIVTKLAGRYFGILRRISSFNNPRYQWLGFGAEAFYLCKRGLLGPFGLFRNCLEMKLVPGSKDEKLRARLFAEADIRLRARFQLLLDDLGLDVDASERSQLSTEYIRLLIDWFPIGFLEGLAANMENARSSCEYMRGNNVNALMGEVLSSDAGYFVCAAARQAGRTIIGVQHGAGHYGYIEDMSIVGQFEFPFYDTMITWGWQQTDAHFPDCRMLPLPSPKLSEKPLSDNYIDALRIPSRARDVLFLSNLFHRFPPPSTCGQARVDFIDEITTSQASLMHAMCEAGLTLDHKPYSMRYVDLYPSHYERLAVAGGKGYRLLVSTHKGLTRSLIKSCRIVLWDQIGSGTLECFTSEVPTIVYWKRIYSREAPSAKELVEGLERFGVVHTDPRTLAQEIKTYLEDPERWMTHEGRRGAIRAFCDKFALTSPRWYDDWRSALADFRPPKIRRRESV